jgi:L-aspartate oxidase
MAKSENDSSRTVDFLVLGAGIAGLRAAMTLAKHGSVLVVTKEARWESNTHYAQGGIAVAMGGASDVASHLQDTLEAGDGLVDRAAAEILVREGPERVDELLKWGTQFDRHGGSLLRTREGAHSEARILHANGDATGAEIGRALAAAAQSEENIQFMEWMTACSLRMDGERVVGAELRDAEGKCQRVLSRAVLLATGGAGQIYSETTNPSVATGDGLLLALISGAVLVDMEMYQFHPTALSLPGVPRFLLSEALRGEGAHLVNAAGERFMECVHPLMELAPRDVVARAMVNESFADGTKQPKPIFLDMRSVRGINLMERFPGISRFLAAHGLRLDRDRIPVSPAAHYMMGGVKTDLCGRTSVTGLYAAGEVAATGVHGANRLASNSLLEGLVFGARAAKAMARDCEHFAIPAAWDDVSSSPSRSALSDAEADRRVETAMDALRVMMWRCAGLLRDAELMREGREELEKISEDVRAVQSDASVSRLATEASARIEVSRAVLECAMARYESRGAHYRNDFPQKQKSLEQLHTHYQMHGKVTLKRFDEFTRIHRDEENDGKPLSQRVNAMAARGSDS